MAYRRTSRTRTARSRTSARRTRRAPSRANSRTPVRRSTSRVRGSSRSNSPRTLRIVVETTPSSGVARPELMQAESAPRKAKF